MFHSKRRHASVGSQVRATVRRGRQAVRPGLEVLEGRALLAASPLDPSFGTGGVVLGAVNPGYAQTSVSALAVQSDGKIVAAAKVGATATGTSNSASVIVERFNADGSIDTGFGTKGQTILPLPGGATGILTGARDVTLAIQLNGSIVAAVGQLNSSAGNSSSFVAQLTPSGQLDTNFGASGEYVLPASAGFVDTLALQSDGKIVAAGNGGGGLLTIRLTTAGVLDPSFNGTGMLTSFGVASATSFAGVLAAQAIALAPSGQIYLALSEVSGNNEVKFGEMIRINGDGTQDGSYGPVGVQSVATLGLTGALSGVIVGSDGKVLVVGSYGFPGLSFKAPPDNQPILVRLLADGSTDPSFQATSARRALVSGFFNAAVVGTDGKITAAGSTTAGSLLIERFTATGVPDISFGKQGQMVLTVSPSPGNSSSTETINSLALTASTKIVVGGGISKSLPDGSSGSQNFLAQVLPILTSSVVTTNDLDGDGNSDFAVELTNLGIYAYRKSSLTGDVLQTFGSKGPGASIPVLGDYDGDAKPDVAVYLPTTGTFAYRPSSGGNDILVQFGAKGIGASIPAPGDYFGTGVTALAVYLPDQGAFAIRGPGGVGNVLAPFGVKGTGQSIPAPGDYDGDGITDLAVYIPSQGVLAYRPSSGGADVKVSFGSAGPGASIPAPGDYDGDGKTDVAVYLPASASFAIHPSSNVANYLIPFGMKGVGNSIPAPGDYDGDGRTDAAVYLPTQGLYAYRPSGGGNDVVQSFGTKGPGATVPAASIPYALASSSTGSTSGRDVGATGSAAVFIPLTDDLIPPLTPSKKASTHAIGSA